MFPWEVPSLANESNTVSLEKLEFPVPSTFDVGETQSETTTLTNRRSSPQEQENTGLVEPSPLSPDPLCQADRDIPDESAVSSPTPQVCGSPQLNQLLSDLEEMKLRNRPETLNLPLSGSSDGSLDVNQMYTFEDFSPEDQTPSEHSSSMIISVSSAIHLDEDTAVAESARLQTPIQDEQGLGFPELSEPHEASPECSPGKHEDSPIFPTESILISDSSLGFNPEVKEPSLRHSSDIVQSSKHSEETFPQSHIPETSLTQSIPDQDPHVWEETYVQHEDPSPAGRFSLEQPIPCPSTGNVGTFSEDRPQMSGWNSEGSLTPEDEEYFACQPTLVKHKAEITSPCIDEEDSIPPEYSECLSTTTRPPVLHGGTDSSAFEYSDPESYFDCKQAASDFSENESDVSKRRTRSGGDQPQDRLSQPTVLEKRNHRVLLSSGSEDYEDASLACEPLHNVHEQTKELRHHSETSDEEFILSEASQLPPAYKCWPNDDTDKSLTRVRRGLINHSNLQAFPTPELNPTLYLLQRGMTAKPHGWDPNVL